MKTSTIMSIWKKWSKNSMKTEQTLSSGVLTTLSIGGEAIAFGRLHSQPVAVVLNSWQWELHGMILPASGLK